MTGAHDAFADERGAWVLGALLEQEAARFSDHLKSCTACQEEVATLQRAADDLVEAAGPAPVPPELKGRIMEIVRGEAELLRAASAPATPETDAMSTRRTPLAVAAAVLAALAFAAGGFALGAGSGDDRSGSTVQVAPVERLLVSGSGARATVRRTREGALLMLDDLGPPQPGRVYQAWLRVPGRPLASTNRLFSVSDGGQAIVALPSLAGIEEIVVTAERPTGADSPTLPPVLAARRPGGRGFP